MDFRAAVERYCDLIENAESHSREDFVRSVTTALADLLSAGSHLPVPELEDVHDDLPSIAEAECRARMHAVQRVLGDWDGYWTTVDPHARDGEVAWLSPAEDLADVWSDLKSGLVGLQRGVPANDVTWEWQWGYVWHWGGHATEALRSLHSRLAEEP